MNGVVEEYGKCESVLVLVLGTLNSTLLLLVLALGGDRGACLEELVVGVKRDGLDGEEDVRGAHGIGLGENLGGLLGDLLEAASAGEKVVGVSFGIGAGQLGALDDTSDGGNVSLLVLVAPPGPVGPASCASQDGAAVACVRGTAGTRLGAALNDEEITAFDLGHDACEDSVDEGVERGVAMDVMCYVDLKTLVGRDWRSDGLDQRLKGGNGERADVAAYGKRLAGLGRHMFDSGLSYRIHAKT